MSFLLKKKPINPNGTDMTMKFVVKYDEKR